MNRIKNYLLALAAVIMTFLGGNAAIAQSVGVSSFYSYNLVNSSYVNIGDLASQNSTGSNQQITPLTKGLVLASAQVQISNPGGKAVRGSCQLLISDGTGPLNGLTPMGYPAVWHTTDDPAYDLTVTVLGYSRKSTSPYNVVVQCQQLGALGATQAQLSNLIVWQNNERR